MLNAALVGGLIAENRGGPGGSTIGYSDTTMTGGDHGCIPSAVNNRRGSPLFGQPSFSDQHSQLHQSHLHLSLAMPPTVEHDPCLNRIQFLRHGKKWTSFTALRSPADTGFYDGTATDCG